jgi:AcrR family transcriptional regulator
MVEQRSASRTARARVRAELTDEIKAVARRQLEAEGSAAISLRAVAREMGMVSSAMYRYFPSRDELLTALIVDAYQAVADAAEGAEARVRRRDGLGRWMATARAVRSWAVAHEQEYSLIFGSPVPGYQAPQDTVNPAARIPLLLLGILNDAAAAGTLLTASERSIPRAIRSDLRTLRLAFAPALAEAQLARAVSAWSQLIGCVSFELFGHLKGTITDYDAYFDFVMRTVASELGLARPA